MAAPAKRNRRDSRCMSSQTAHEHPSKQALCQGLDFDHIRSLLPDRKFCQLSQALPAPPPVKSKRREIGIGRYLSIFTTVPVTKDPSLEVDDIKREDIEATGSVAVIAVPRRCKFLNFAAWVLRWLTPPRSVPLASHWSVLASLRFCNPYLPPSSRS